MCINCTRSEMDITTDFESVIGGSNPSECTLAGFEGRTPTWVGGGGVAVKNSRF